MNFRSRCLHLSNVMDTKDMLWLRPNLSYAARPKDPSAQAPSPTCPFIIINHVKEPTNTADNLSPGIRQGLLIHLCRRPNPAKSAFPRPCPLGDAAYMTHHRVGQPHSCNFIAEPIKYMFLQHNISFYPQIIRNPAPPRPCRCSRWRRPLTLFLYPPPPIRIGSRRRMPPAL